MKAFTVALLVCLAAIGSSFGASIVKVTLKQDGNVISRAIYTGPDGGRTSDPAPYWKLLAQAPQFTSDVAISPDVENGKVATLKGKVEVSIQIRNKFSMGVAKTDSLTLIRKNDGQGWYLSKEELKRVMKLVEHGEPR